MPIEDVDYLKSNSVRQSYMFLVDSADRNKLVYPTPAEYVVDFTYPFHHVVGLEVIHASVPRTMYNIDKINNKIMFGIYEYSSTNMDVKKEVEISPGEYTIQTLLVALNEVLHMNVNNDPRKPYIHITAESTTNPPDIESKIMFRCSYPFALFMGASSSAETLGFDELTQPSEALLPISKQRYVWDANDRRLFKSVYVPPSSIPPSKQIINTVFDGPRGVIRKTQLQPGYKVAQRFKPKSSGFLRKIYAALYSPDNVSSVVAWEVRSSPLSENVIASGTIAVSFVDGTLNDSNDINDSYVYEAGKEYWLILHTSAGDPYVYYNDVLVTEDIMQVWDPTSSAWTSLDGNGIYYNACVRIDMMDRFNYVEAPGIYVLTGPKYIVLRCPEIENNSFRSLAFTKHNMGMGMIRLGVVGYSDNRLDFNKVQLREFHPIGKLSRLTLRLELPSGELYDFKGVNHTITFAVHYLEPAQKRKFETSILNPNYDGDFIHYMYKAAEQESDSDDQEEDFSKDVMKNYRREEQLYLPENVARRNQDFAQQHWNDFDEYDE